jgi:hypothetical protein
MGQSATQYFAILALSLFRHKIEGIRQNFGFSA